MKKLVQINVVSNTGSTGRIMEDIGSLAVKHGWESYVCYGRYGNPSSSNEIKIGNKWDNYLHVIKTRLFDKHGLASTRATKEFLNQLDRINPDIIHLHNLHGYYINIKILFDYLIMKSIPIVWTLHDCWAFTGHCSYFTLIDCNKWESQCKQCPQIRAYPTSYWLDRSKENYTLKKNIFSQVESLTMVPVSYWLSDLLEKSFLKETNKKVIHNGINLEVFKDRKTEKPLIPDLKDKFVILGVANIWNERKGWSDFLELSKKISKDEHIILVGLSKSQLKGLPNNIYGVMRTENITQLAEIYSYADVFVNPTYEDNFPTTNLEAISCGTPVITYDTGGSPEAVDEKTGFVVAQGNLSALYEKIQLVKKNGNSYYAPHCIEKGKKMFNKSDRYLEYFELYNTIMNE